MLLVLLATSYPDTATQLAFLHAALPDPTPFTARAEDCRVGVLPSEMILELLTVWRKPPGILPNQRFWDARGIPFKIPKPQTLLKLTHEARLAIPF